MNRTGFFVVGTLIFGGPSWVSIEEDKNAHHDPAVEQRYEACGEYLREGNAAPRMAIATGVVASFPGAVSGGVWSPDKGFR